jgi:hypothetical protein
MNQILLPNARLYATPRQLDLAESLGSGKDGIVLAAKHKAKPAAVAIKVLHSAECYWREKRAYQRLSTMAVTTVRGFNVPELIAFDDELLVLEMTIVRRPFVLDFASAYLDSDKRPEFPDDTWATWEEEKREQFDWRWPVVKEVLAAFGRLGIYLFDVSPGNIGFLEEG